MKTIALPALVAILVLLIAGTIVLTAIVGPELPPIGSRIIVSADPLDITISRADDADKLGSLRSVMGQRIQSQEPRTSGPSPDTLRFVFDAPARIVGVRISVDVWRPLTLAEWAIGINAATPYGLVEAGTHEHREFVARDWLLHVSSTGDSIDQQAWFGEGFEVGAGDAVTVDAWLQNSGTELAGLSPEVIVYYEWLPVDG